MASPFCSRSRYRARAWRAERGGSYSAPSRRESERSPATQGACVDASGRTVGERGGVRREGRVEIANGGRACFTHRSDSLSSCFLFVREGEAYRVDAFVTRVVRRGVTACGAGDEMFVQAGAEGRRVDGTAGELSKRFQGLRRNLQGASQGLKTKMRDAFGAAHLLGCRPYFFWSASRFCCDAPGGLSGASPSWRSCAAPSWPPSSSVQLSSPWLSWRPS